MNWKVILFLIVIVVLLFAIFGNVASTDRAFGIAEHVTGTQPDAYTMALRTYEATRTTKSPIVYVVLGVGAILGLLALMQYGGKAARDTKGLVNAIKRKPKARNAPNAQAQAHAPYVRTIEPTPQRTDQPLLAPPDDRR